MSPELQALNQDQKPEVPALRIVPHIEGSRSLHFEIIEREVPEGVAIKIGRFTDKAQVPNRVTFKSKVVSRGHAEIWHSEGKFYIKDTRSSSGTFLNHVRLSTPNSESRPFLLKDGDVVQLGMRIELNRSWQRPINQFSLNTLKQFKQITQMSNSEGIKNPPTTDCCICLSGIGPCQALFLAPCSHVFHYKCIRPILFSHHSGFLCPLCRSFADLEAPIDNSVDWEQVGGSAKWDNLLAEEEPMEEESFIGDNTNGNNDNIWDSAFVMVQLFREKLANNKRLFDNKKILDLSSGNGFVGTHLAALITDLKVSNDYKKNDVADNGIDYRHHDYVHHHHKYNNRQREFINNYNNNSNETKIVMTDLKHALPLIKKNISLNRYLLGLTDKISINVEYLKWGDLNKAKKLGTLDYVLASDVVYEP
ncbi:13965_t:CDS:2, partial [Entrophospora sp. SA101]